MSGGQRVLTPRVRSACCARRNQPLKSSAHKREPLPENHTIPAPSAPWRSDYFPILDGWRAVAIIGVLVCHCCEPIFHSGGLYPNPVLSRITRHGAFGVDIFFGISGFLICSRLLHELHSKGEISLVNFYIRRAFRILPPYLTYLLVVGVLAYSGALLVHRWEWLSCLLFFRNYIAQREASWYLGHFWSLAVEEHFYLIWPGILVLFGPRRTRWAAVLLSLSVAGWRTLNAHEQWMMLAGGVSFYRRTDIRLDGLLWGCWVALMIDNARWRALLTNSMSLGTWIVLMAVLICCIAYTPPLAMLWQAILVPILLVGTVVRPISLLAWLLEARLMRWIGRISYSLYIWQQLFLVSSGEVHSGSLGRVEIFPINILFAFAAAIVSYYVIERPMITIGYSVSARLISKPKKGRKLQAAWRRDQRVVFV